MHLEFLVEEQSAEEVLKILLPKFVDQEHTYRIHAFQGKQALLKNLQSRLRT